MDIYGILICVGMFLCSSDGYNAIQYVRKCWKLRKMRVK